MPTYTYQCKKCKKLQLLYHSMTDKPRVKCPECGAGCKRQLGAGGGLIFKGSGFYATDYRKADSKRDKAPETAGKAESKGEAKGGSDKGSGTSSTSPSKD